MIKSMTGYGSATGRVQSAEYSLQIKTVNNKYLKTNIKLPDALSFLETDVEHLLRNELHRGTVNYIFHLKTDGEASRPAIDRDRLQNHLQNLQELAGQAPVACNIDLATLLTLPGIIQQAAPDEQQTEQIRGEVLATSRRALQELKQTRLAEGSALYADLKQNCKQINQNLAQIRKRSATAVKQYHDKLKSRVEQLLAEARLELDADTLSREVAIYADRCDISEELARLESHLELFLDTCEQLDHPGRKLDFITQEMLREANTIASKASDAEIVRCVIEIKCHVDRLKEQVQNVE